MSDPDPADAPHPTDRPTAHEAVVTQRRLPVVDAARGLCLAAMAAYHTLWDLGFLRLTPENYALTGGGRAAAHAIAGSFLLLVGVGVVLMNGAGIHWRATLRRLLRIGTGALLVTAGTYLAFPETYVFFGILHCIAVSSLVALAFLRWPAWMLAPAGLAVIAAPFVVAHPLLDAPALAFLGLGQAVPRTNDFVPLFPWFGPVLLGMALAKLGLPILAASRAGSWQPRRWPGRAAAFAGRHSLIVYLIHQPVLLALLSGLAALTGPHPRAGWPEFRRDYVAICTRTGGSAEACRIAARCTAEALRAEGLWSRGERSFTTPERLRAQRLSGDCYAAAEGSAPPP
jgi:uncharacterized membrane protein